MNSIAMNREWDVQSMHSDAISGTTLGGAVSPQLGQGTSAEYLRDLVQKRIITLTYIRNIHEGYAVCFILACLFPLRLYFPFRRSHWFHTIQISRAELDREFNNAIPEVKKRYER